MLNHTKHTVTVRVRIPCCTCLCILPAWFKICSGNQKIAAGQRSNSIQSCTRFFPPQSDTKMPDEKRLTNVQLFLPKSHKNKLLLQRVGESGDFAVSGRVGGKQGKE